MKYVIHNTNTNIIVVFENEEELWKALPSIVDDSDYLMTFIYEGEFSEPMKDVTDEYIKK